MMLDLTADELLIVEQALRITATSGIAGWHDGYVVHAIHLADRADTLRQQALQAQRRVMPDTAAYAAEARARYASHSPSFHPHGTTCPTCTQPRPLPREQALMVRDQGAAIAIGGGLLCSQCGTQVPAGSLDGAGQCSRCAS